MGFCLKQKAPRKLRTYRIRQPTAGYDLSRCSLATFYLAPRQQPPGPGCLHAARVCVDLVFSVRRQAHRSISLSQALVCIKSRRMVQYQSVAFLIAFVSVARADPSYVYPGEGVPSDTIRSACVFCWREHTGMFSAARSEIIKQLRLERLKRSCWPVVK